MDIWGYICLPFGYLIKWCYQLTGSYAIALFMFAFAVKLILFPFGVKQQKNSIRQAKLRPKEQAIRNKYAGRTDQVTQQKMQQEIMDLYQKEGYNPAGGCLPLLIQMPVIFALYSVVRSPITYISGVASDVVLKLKETAAPFLNMAVENAKNIEEINVVSVMEKNREAFAAFGDIEIPNMQMFGLEKLNLADTPSWETLLTPIIIIPLLVLITGYAQQFIIQRLSYQPNPEAAKQMRGMNIVMPLMTVWFSFMLPAALGLYWSFQNIFGIAQQFIVHKIYPIPVVSEEEIKAAEREYKAAQKHNVKVASKRRSIVYDDDDDIPQVSVSNPKQKKSEAEQPEKTKELIEPAPLKEDNKKDDK